MNFRCSILGSPIDFKHIIVLIDKKKLYFLKTIQFNTINYNASQIWSGARNYFGYSKKKNPM